MFCFVLFSQIIIDKNTETSNFSNFRATCFYLSHYKWARALDKSDHLNMHFQRAALNSGIYSQYCFL